MPRVSPVAPAIQLSVGGISDPTLRVELQSLTRQLIRLLGDMRRDISAVDHQYVSQNSQPTPAEGELLVWKDADAGAGQSKAYLVTTQAGVVYTFKSVEVV